MSDAGLDDISSIITAYLPSDDASSESMLLQRLTTLQPPPKPTTGAVFEHPICVTRLVLALMLQIWVSSWGPLEPCVAP